MLFVNLTDFLIRAAADLAVHAANTRRQRPARVPRGGTLRPGAATPLWNQLRDFVRAHCSESGDQAALGRLLGIPRQRVHEFLSRGSHMPDAERTLRLVAWLAAVQAAANGNDKTALRRAKRFGSTAPAHS